MAPQEISCIIVLVHYFERKRRHQSCYRLEPAGHVSCGEGHTEHSPVTGEITSVTLSSVPMTFVFGVRFKHAKTLLPTLWHFKIKFDYRQASRTCVCYRNLPWPFKLESVCPHCVIGLTVQSDNSIGKWRLVIVAGGWIAINMSDFAQSL